MSGNRNGGLKAAQANKERHGDDFYKNIGRIGGAKSKGGGFAVMAIVDPDRLKEIGRKGGSASRRKKIVNK